MTNYTTITDYPFKFCDHPLCSNFSNSLNNTYAEPFENTVIDWFFTNANKTAVANDVIAVIRTAIIDTILVSSTTDRIVFVPIINQILLFAFGENPNQNFSVQTTNTITTYFNTVVTDGHTTVVFQLNTASFF